MMFEKHLPMIFTFFILILLYLSVLISQKRTQENYLKDESDENPIDDKSPSLIPINIPINTKKDNIKPGYMAYTGVCMSPKIYHRYQANICDQKQDELPITMPDPNEGTIRPVMDKLYENVYFGSLPCNQCNNLNFCQ
jgi:hypothetical protein